MDGGGRGRDADVPAPVAVGPSAAPHSKQAEWSVVGQMLARPRDIGPIVGTMLEDEHFYTPTAKLVYGEVVAAYYADEPTDPVSIGTRISKKLARALGTDEQAAVSKLSEMSVQFGGGATGRAVDHAKVIRRHADTRNLMTLAYRLLQECGDEDVSPEELAGSVAHDAMRIATGTMTSSELVPFDSIRAKVLQRQQMMKAARAQGVEIGAYFGLSFIDSFTRGLRPGELFFLAGEPGAGKSAVAWVMAKMFAEKQLRKDTERRIGTLIASLEMADEPAEDRITTAASQVDGGRLREGLTTAEDIEKINDTWTKRRGLPLVFNYSSTVRASQLRAIVVEAIRRHNTGVVVVDHFRYVEMDPPATRRHWGSSLEAEEALARFLKQDIAKQLNVAVICLAHTTKAGENRMDPRPKLRDLRGGQLVAGHADHVAFVFRPYPYADEDDIESERVKRTDAEMIYEKNRHGLTGSASFFFDPATMVMY